MIDRLHTSTYILCGIINLSYVSDKKKLEVNESPLKIVVFDIN